MCVFVCVCFMAHEIEAERELFHGPGRKSSEVQVGKGWKGCERKREKCTIRENNLRMNKIN